MASTRLLVCIVLNSALYSQASGDTHCDKFWKNKKPNIITRDNKALLFGNGSTTHYNATSTVLLECISDAYEVNGSNVIECLPNGNWTDIPINCLPRPVTAKSESVPWDVIGGSVGGGVGLAIIILVLVIIVCVSRSKKNKRNRGLDKHLVYNDGNRFSVSYDNPRNSLHGDHTYINNMDNRRDSGNHRPQRHHMSMASNDGYRSIDDISLVGSNASMIGSSSIPVFKVWTCRRTRRKFIRAENLAMLKRKASIMYQFSNQVRLVLEEDGTQIDTDDVLMTCVGKTLVVLNGNEQWRDLDGHSNVPTQRFTFEVCSHDRSVKKLVLAENLRDLMYQGSTYFGYPVTEICLESDGTSIDDDDVLLSMSSQTLIAMGVYHTWSPGSTAAVSIPVEKESHQPKQLRDMSIKVWSEDMTKKRIVKAENSIDLHIKAAKALGLEMPVQIKVKDEDIVISTDIILQSNIEKILIVSERGNMNLNIETKTNPYESDYAKVIRPFESKNDQSKSEQMFPQRYTTRPSNETSSSMTQQTKQPIKRDEPDIVSSSQVPETMPSRYLSTGPKPIDNDHNQKTSAYSGFVRNQRDVNEAVVYRPKKPVTDYFSDTPMHNRSIEDHYSMVQDEPVIQSAGRPTQSKPSNMPVNRELKSERLESPRSLYPNLNTKAPKNHDDTRDLPYSDLSPSYQLNLRDQPSKRDTHDNPGGLPYSDLSPSNQLNLRREQPSKRHTSDDTGGLPYSDLTPSNKHGQKRQQNNFDMMRQKGNPGSPVLDRYNHDNRPLKLNYNSPYMVTGGAPQSRNSDVLF